MYGSGHHNGHNALFNGGHGNRFGIGINGKGYQSHNHQNHRQPQDHLTHGNYANHQHNTSGSGFPTSMSQYNNGGRFTAGASGQGNNGHNAQPNEHWDLQIKLLHESRQNMTGTHAHARHQNANRSAIAASGTSTSDNEAEDRNRTLVRTEQEQQQSWHEMDMGGQGLRALSDKLFRYNFLKKLYLNSNNLHVLPPGIGRLRQLEHLDLSQNQLVDLPSEIGMLVNLKQLLLFDNPIRVLPDSIGYLHRLEMLGIADMPTLDTDQRETLEIEGTEKLIYQLRENAPDDMGPVTDREFHDLDESGSIASNGVETFSVLSHNILCDKYATTNQYGYLPKRVLSWEYRRERILDELLGRNDDIICLQEIDQESFNEYFRPKLAQKDYRGVFWPKGRARTMAEREARLVDGCATFFRNRKYVLLDKQHIDYANTAINRSDMKGEHDVFNRVMPRDDVALICFLEHRSSGARIMVANTHIYWNAAYADVKVVQTAILMEQIQRLADEWTRVPACKDKTPYRYSAEDAEDGDVAESIVEPGPSMHYSSGSQIPLIICSDLNSLPDSGVYQLLSTGALDGTHSDLKDRSYGELTRKGMSHVFPLKSAYGSIGEMKFTNYTPGFTGVIDYIWYTTSSLQVTGLLGDIDPDYMQRVPGFPNAHFPSDHVALEARFSVKARRDPVRRVDVDFPR